jgi:4-hydroxybenzoate polyprenyltransferase
MIVIACGFLFSAFLMQRQAVRIKAGANREADRAVHRELLLAARRREVGSGILMIVGLVQLFFVLLFFFN